MIADVDCRIPLHCSVPELSVLITFLLTQSLRRISLISWISAYSPSWRRGYQSIKPIMEERRVPEQEQLKLQEYKDALFTLYLLRPSRKYMEARPGGDPITYSLYIGPASQRDSHFLELEEHWRSNIQTQEPIGNTFYSNYNHFKLSEPTPGLEEHMSPKALAHL